MTLQRSCAILQLYQQNMKSSHFSTCLSTRVVAFFIIAMLVLHYCLNPLQSVNLFDPLNNAISRRGNLERFSS